MTSIQLRIYADNEYIQANPTDFVDINSFTNNEYMRKKTFYMIKTHIQKFIRNNDKYSPIPFYTHMFYTLPHLHPVSIHIKDHSLYIKQADFADILSQVLKEDFIITRKYKWFWETYETFYLTFICKSQLKDKC